MKTMIHNYSNAKVLTVIVATLWMGGVGAAQTYTPMPPYIPDTPAVYPPAPAATPQIPQLSDTQLGDLTATIALYPDPLLATMLPAATYPLDVVGAKQWLDQHPNPDDATIDGLPYQPAVKALMHYPDILNMMADHVDWTQALGTAVTYQQADVLNAIQHWRGTALVDGTLISTAQQEIIDNDGLIEILPVVPDSLYIPIYEPSSIYTRHDQRRHDLIRFEAAGCFGRWLDFDLNWRDHAVCVPDRPWWERPNGDDHRRWEEIRHPAVIMHEPQPIGSDRAAAVVRPPEVASAIERRAFVRGDDKRPTLPDNAVIPDADHKVVVFTGNRGDDAHGRGPADNPGRGYERRADAR